MATYIKTLKEDNGDITYPQTKAGAVLLTNGSDLETVLATKADASTVNQKITVGDVQSTDIVANAVTTAKITDGAVTSAKLAKGAVTSDKIDFTTLKYSSSPVVVGTWINGKTIYRRVYNFGALPNTSTKDIAHGITNLDRVIDIRGWAYRPSDQTRCPLPFVSTSTLGLGIALGPVTPTLIRLTCGSDRSAFTESYIILDYTTTD